jgi:hypothetical protein
MKNNMNLSFSKIGLGSKWMALAALFASSMLIGSVSAQSSAPANRTVAATSPQNPMLANRVSRREAAYFGLFWGVDSLRVKAVESGELIRFSYHVLDATKAKSLNDKKIDAFLELPTAQIRLVVPSLEKVGQLRQTSTSEAGKSYWMAFSNPGRTVKRGDRVNIAIGQFHADGLMVE